MFLLFRRQMGQIYLGGRQGAVPEIHLQDVDIAALAQIVNREPMSEIVEAEGFEGGIQLGGAFDEDAESAGDVPVSQPESMPEHIYGFRVWNCAP